MLSDSFASNVFVFNKDSFEILIGLPLSVENKTEALLTSSLGLLLTSAFL